MSEVGWATSKYTAIRKLMKYSILEIPVQIPGITLPNMKIKLFFTRFGITFKVGNH